MADIDSTKVTVGKRGEGGCGWVSFGEGEIPSDASTSLSGATGWESVGELSENGFTEGKSISSTDLSGWHGKTLLSVTDSTTDTYSAEFVEVARGTVAKLRYGADNVTVDADGVVTQIDDNDENDDEVTLVFDELESNGWLRRTVVRRAKVTSIDDVSHVRNALMVYGMTFTALEPSDGSAKTSIYRAEPAAA